jgi:cytoskeletal protein RodZ
MKKFMLLFFLIFFLAIGFAVYYLFFAENEKSFKKTDDSNSVIYASTEENTSISESKISDDNISKDVEGSPDIKHIAKEFSKHYFSFDIDKPSAYIDNSKKFMSASFLDSISDGERFKRLPSGQAYIEIENINVAPTSDENIMSVDFISVAYDVNKNEVAREAYIYLIYFDNEQNNWYVENVELLAKESDTL